MEAPNSVASSYSYGVIVLGELYKFHCIVIAIVSLPKVPTDNWQGTGGNYLEKEKPQAMVSSKK